MALPAITAHVSPNSATVGDAILLNIALKIPKGAKIVPPETEKGFGDFTVLYWSGDSAPAAGKEGDSALYRYGIAAYKPQNCTIPPIPFLVGLVGGAGGGTLYDTLATPQIPIEIVSVLPENAPDSGFAIKDLKAQQKTGKADIRSLWLLLIAAAAIAAYFLIEKYARKRVTITMPTVQLKPPYEEAIESIAALQQKKYLDRGAVREYAFELSDIFKRYIGRRYDTIAPELTTGEIVSWFEFSGISREMRACAERFLRSSDQVKFAKWKPDRQAIDKFMRDVIMFLEATKPEPTLPYEQKTERMGAVE
ncbi:MAG: hypothetical protein LBH93_05675 [Chitinispirillales bacterium]|jgi:hypothetical protein|nr:hypothetical protein [Chitinispirillales bacterium]